MDCILSVYLSIRIYTPISISIYLSIYPCMYIHRERYVQIHIVILVLLQSGLAYQDYGGIHRGWRGESTRRAWAQGANRFSGYGGGFTWKHPEIWLEELYSPGEDPWIPCVFFLKLLLSYIKPQLGQYGWKLDGWRKSALCLRMPGKITNWIYEWIKTLLICDLPLKIREPVRDHRCFWRFNIEIRLLQLGWMGFYLFRSHTGPWVPHGWMQSVNFFSTNGFSVNLRVDFADLVLKKKGLVFRPQNDANFR